MKKIKYVELLQIMNIFSKKKKKKTAQSKENLKTEGKMRRRCD